MIPSHQGLKGAVLPAGLQKLGRYAFGYCSILETVVIPGELAEIGDAAFSKCDVLTLTVVKDGPAEAYATVNGIPLVYAE